jgi:ubiquinone/menaquinone biosynthesis C-methylase UbiE
MSRQSEIKQYYESRYGAGDLGMSMRSPESFKPILNWLEVKPGNRLLDIGCGSGSLLSNPEKITDPWGIDISENAIRISKERVPEAMYCVGDMQNLPYKRGSFDKVTNIGGLEHAPNMEKALHEIKRVCKDAGMFCIVVPNKDFLLYRILPIEGTKQSAMEEHLLTLRNWKRLFNSEGINIVSINADRGPKIRKDLGIFVFFRGIIRKFILMLICLLPLDYTYQFVFICRK